MWGQFSDLSQVARLELAFGREDLDECFLQVLARLAIELDRGRLAPAVHEAERYARALVVENGLVDGHASLLIRVRDNKGKIYNVVLLSS